MATSVAGLSADWLIVSLSDTCTTSEEMFVTAGVKLFQIYTEHNKFDFSKRKPNSISTFTPQKPRQQIVECLGKFTAQMTIVTLPWLFFIYAFHSFPNHITDYHISM